MIVYRIFIFIFIFFFFNKKSFGRENEFHANLGTYVNNILATNKIQRLIKKNKK